MSYRKPTSKRWLREQYTKELAAIPEGDPRRLRILTRIERLEAREAKPVPPEPTLQPVIVDDGNEPVSEEIQRRSDEFERLERAWKAYSNKQPLPDDAPEVVRYVAAMRRR